MTNLMQHSENATEVENVLTLLPLHIVSGCQEMTTDPGQLVRKFRRNDGGKTEGIGLFF